MNTLINCCEKVKGNITKMLLLILKIGVNTITGTFGKIKSMGPGKSEIPFQVMHNGIITTDTDIVLDTWKNDFEKLYNPSLENMDVAFANEIEKQKKKTLKMTGKQNFKLP